MTMTYDELEDLMKKNDFRVGEKAFLISTEFVKELKESEITKIPVLAIDNSSLLQNNTLKRNLTEKKDYLVVDYKVWQTLISEFDVNKTISVKILENGRFDLYHLNLTVHYNNIIRRLAISGDADVSTLLLRIVMEFQISPEIHFEIYNFGKDEPIKLDGEKVGDILSQNASLEVRIVNRTKKSHEKHRQCVKPEYRSVLVQKKSVNEQVGVARNPKPAGILNIGNTCYIGAALQCLASLVPFVNMLNHVCDKIDTPELTRKLSLFFKELLATKDDVLDPTRIKEVLSKYIPFIARYGQQDSHEFLLSLINKLYDEFPTEIGNLFYGEFSHITKCIDCNHESVMHESSPIISLSLTGTKRLLFIPFNMDEPMFRYYNPPSDRKCILVARSHNSFVNVEWPALEYDEIFALEVPELVKQDKRYSILTVSYKSKLILTPILIEVKVKEKIKDSRLFGWVCSRISCLWDKDAFFKIKDHMKILNTVDRFHCISDVLSEPICVKFEINAHKDPTFKVIRSRPSVAAATLNELLDGYLAHCRLDSENTWKCKNCPTETKAVKSVKSIRSPTILTLQLKRYCFETRAGRDSTVVEIPKNISFGNKNYKLEAVLNHAGGTGSGHYTAICTRENDVFNFNDSKVSHSKGIPSRSHVAYVIFYSELEDQTLTIPK